MRSPSGRWLKECGGRVLSHTQKYAIFNGKLHLCPPISLPSSTIDGTIPPPSSPPTATKAAFARLKATPSLGGSLKEALNLVLGQTGVSIPALKSAYHRSRTGHGGTHGNARLTVDEEQVLVGVAQAFSLNNFPLTTAQIQAVV